MSKFISNTEKVTVENYPYGFRLKTTLYDEMEFSPKKGFRHVTTTINPKNGRLNKPKKSTYDMGYSIRFRNAETGYIEIVAFHSFSGLKAMQDAVNLFKECLDFITPEEKAYIVVQFYKQLVVDMKASVIYCGIEVDTIKELFADIIEIVNTDIKNKTFNLIDYDYLALHDKVEGVKVEGFSPFRTVRHGE